MSAIFTGAARGSFLYIYMPMSHSRFQAQRQCNHAHNSTYQEEGEFFLDLIDCLRSLYNLSILLYG